jgi:hypothetical protein
MPFSRPAFRPGGQAAVHRVRETCPLLTVIQYYLYVTTMADDSGLRDRLYRDMLREHLSQLARVTATDLLEHLTKDEVLDTFDLVNAVSPLGGHIRYGDFTHESSYTARSVRQLAVAAGFGSVAVLTFAACKSR